MAFWTFRERLCIEGIMPERALLRLKRAGIGVYNVKKPQKNQILLSVKKKDSEKVFAIYPKVCYNISAYSPYTVRSLGLEGLGGFLEKAKNRIGAVLGALLFCGLTLAADPFVLGVEFVGSDVYKREALAALEEHGIKMFSAYTAGEEDLVCSKILSLSGVEYCSVKKTGLWVRVEIRTSSFETVKKTQGSMCAERAGTVLSLTALKGTPLKKAGDEIRVGEPLVGNWLETQDGGQVRVEVIARACIACVYEEDVAAEDGEIAFANAYLALGLADSDTLTEKSVLDNGDGTFRVKISYTVTQRMNL